MACHPAGHTVLVGEGNPCIPAGTRAGTEDLISAVADNHSAAKAAKKTPVMDTHSLTALWLHRLA